MSEFGRRGRSAGGRRLGGDAERPAAERETTPTHWRGVALACFGLFLMQFAILIAQRAGAGVSGLASGDPAAAFAPPPAAFLYGVTMFLFILAVGAAPIAAVYALLAHAVLRWLKMSSPAAYALGGFCVAYTFLALWAVQGQHLRWRGALIELAGGALVGWLYRVGAGLVPAAGAAKGMD